MIWVASKALDKGWSYETMMYSDDMYGRESFADEVWDLVCECKDIGILAFKEKYKEHKMYF